MEAVKRIVIADNAALLREGVKRLITEMEDLCIAGEAADDTTTIKVVEDTQPDVLLLDLYIPKSEALPVLSALREAQLSTRIIVLCHESNEAKILECAKAGAHGFILKSASPEMLAEAIRQVLRGRIWADDQAGCADIFTLLTHRAHVIANTGARVNPFDVLSGRELEILDLIARGASNEAIGKELFISITTVKVHASHIFSKLNVSNRTQAALLLMQARWSDNYNVYETTAPPAPIPKSSSQRALQAKHT